MQVISHAHVVQEILKVSALVPVRPPGGGSTVDARAAYDRTAGSGPPPGVPSSV